MKLTAQGRAGHGSMMNGENAVTALTEAVAKIGKYEWPQRYTQTVKDLFREVARVTGKAYDEKDLRPLLKEIGSTARMIGATLQNTANPTMLEAGYKANVIPGSASAVIDGRFLPGYEEELNTTIRAIIGPDIEIETISHDIALEVNFKAPLVEAMKAALLREDPEGIPVPVIDCPAPISGFAAASVIVAFVFTVVTESVKTPILLIVVPLIPPINTGVLV
jgi:acetylornithine deacetylase/succinyl-diaminopimelate desuccinylase-like protein